jgi:phospholipid/cholesterol/gamma-HCH transport system substrate-binding protein
MRHALRRHQSHLLVLAVAFGIAIGYGYWLVHWLDYPTNGKRLQILVPSARNIAPGASVFISGIKSGSVAGVQRQGNDALMTLSIAPQDWPLPTDTRAQVRERTLVGEMTVVLYPGHAQSMLSNNAMIPASQADQSVDLDQILDVLRGGTRARARAALEGLGAGIGGDGTQLNEFFGTSASALQAGSSLVRVLADDRSQVAQLVGNLGNVAGAIGARGASVSQFAQGLDATAHALAGRDAALRTVIDEMPSTLTQVTTTSHKLDEVSGEIGPVLGNLGQWLKNMQPSVQVLQPAATEGTDVLHELGHAVPRLLPVLGSLRSIAPSATATLPKFRSVFCQANPLFTYLAPYNQALAMVFANMGSATNYTDADGHAARLYGLLSDNSTTIYDQATSKLVNALIGDAGGLLHATRQSGYNPYPAPGINGPPSVGEGVLGPAQAPGVIPYTRVKASC